MHHFLLSLIALSNPLACEDAIDILQRIKPNLPHKAEIVEVLKENTEKGCDWDAQVD